MNHGTAYDEDFSETDIVKGKTDHHHNQGRRSLC